jgi:hypothetical protein
VGVNEAQTAKSMFPGAYTSKVGEQDPGGIPYGDGAYLTRSINEQPDLTPDLPGEQGHGLRKLRGDDPRGGNPSPAETFQGFFLRCFEPDEVAVDCHL